MADPSTEPPTEADVDVDPAVVAGATVVALEAIADLFASFALQANRLAGVLEASIGAAGELIAPWAANALDELRAQQAEREAAEIERHLSGAGADAYDLMAEQHDAALDDARTEVIRLGPAGAAMRFPRP